MQAVIDFLRRVIKLAFLRFDFKLLGYNWEA
jgi:hypothetical protein